MRACCNKEEDNFITYHSTREKIINDVREWEKLNPEKRKEYTIKYYKTEKGHRKRLAQQKRYREKKKLINENEKLKNDKMNLIKKIDDLQQENQLFKKEYDKLSFHYYKAINIEIELQDRIDKALRKIENMFDLGNEETIIDDLLELEKILKGDKNE